MMGSMYRISVKSKHFLIRSIWLFVADVGCAIRFWERALVGFRV